MASTQRFVTGLLGGEAAIAFLLSMEELICYAKAIALDDHDASTDDVRRKFEEISGGIIKESINTYLEENYCQDGNMDVVVQDSMIYDRDMLPIPVVMEVVEHRSEIIGEMTLAAMSEYARGRLIAHKMLTRIERDNRRRLSTEPKRDYEVNPSTEMLEIEAMRIERRLPDVTPEEGKRLSWLYNRINLREK